MSLIIITGAGFLFRKNHSFAWIGELGIPTHSFDLGSQGPSIHLGSFATRTLAILRKMALLAFGVLVSWVSLGWAMYDI